MRQVTLFTFCFFISMNIFAQFPLVDIHDIQYKTDQQLQLGNDTSNYDLDTVELEGVVTFDPCNYGLSSGPNRVGTFLQNTSGGAWSGIHVLIDPAAIGLTSADLANLDADVQFIDNFQVGNVVHATGIVNTFSGYTQIVLLPIASSVINISTLPAPVIMTVDSFMKSDGGGGQIKQMYPGEKYEGALCEFQNVTIVDVVDNGNGRYFWSVQDAAGNKIQIRDMSGWMRNDNYDSYCTQPTNTPWFFPLPQEGAFLSYIRGPIIEYQGQYYVAPRDTNDIGPTTAIKPLVSNVYRDPVVASSTQSVIIHATINDNDSTDIIASSELYFSIGLGNTSFSQVSMTNPNGAQWQGIIPATGTDSVYVNYWIKATDDEGNYTNDPDSLATGSFYLVLDDGIDEISDIQKTPFSGGASIWANDSLDVMDVTAIVTATNSAYDYGTVTIQDDTIPWSGIFLFDDNLDTLNRGDEIHITSARVVEYFAVTHLYDVEYSVVSENNPVPNAILGEDADALADGMADTESFEAMLLGFLPAYVVDTNADSGAGSDFGEWVMNELPGQSDGLRVDDFSYDIDFGFNSDSISAGQQLSYLYGLMYYSFGNWKLQPRNLSDIDGFTTNYPKDITSFGFTSPPVFGTIDQNNLTISVLVFDTTDITSLAPVIQHTGVSVSPANGVAQDFTNSVQYTVTAPVDGSTKTYTVSISTIPLGIGEIYAEMISVYPNPADDEFEVRGLTFEVGKTTLTIYNALGQEMFSSVATFTNLKLQTSNWQPGIYFLKISDGVNDVVKKLSVVR